MLDSNSTTPNFFLLYRYFYHDRKNLFIEVVGYSKMIDGGLIPKTQLRFTPKLVLHVKSITIHTIDSNFGL